MTFVRYQQTELVALLLIFFQLQTSQQKFLHPTVQRYPPPQPSSAMLIWPEGQIGLHNGASRRNRALVKKKAYL